MPAGLPMTTQERILTRLLHYPTDRGAGSICPGQVQFAFLYMRRFGCDLLTRLLDLFSGIGFYFQIMIGFNLRGAPRKKESTIQQVQYNNLRGSHERPEAFRTTRRTLP